MTATISALTYRYPSSTAPALDDINLSFEPGRLTLVCGPSAGGKSTLLRSLNGLVPQFYGGVYSGTVTVAGFDAAVTTARRMATVTGMVFQDPEAQAIAASVEEEIAFGMEQQGVPRDEMLRRCDYLLDLMGIQHLRNRSLSSLSGGERQRVAIASVLALEPALLVLDEPTSQLDPAGAESVLVALEALARTGMTIAVAEHRLDRLLPHADDIVAIADGRVAATGDWALDTVPGLAPPFALLAKQLGLGTVPRTVDDARRALSGIPVRVEPCPGPPSPGDPLLHVRDLTVSYGDVTALDGVSLSLRQGEIVALVGPNGSGKSSLLRAVAGVVSPAAGEVESPGVESGAGVAARTAHAALVPQDPSFALYRDTVLDEVRESLHLRGVPVSRAGDVLERWGISGLARRDPRDLSVGQQQRAAIATMLAHAPPVWMLDEPTRGADAPAKAWLSRALRDHAASGGAAIVSTHDIESAAAFATRVVGLRDGAIEFDLPVREALGHGGPMPTRTAHVVPGAILPGEVHR